MTYYRRKPADASVLTAAVAAGAAIGAATFYVVKLWLQREPLKVGDGVEAGDEGVERPGDAEPETSEGTESSR